MTWVSPLNNASCAAVPGAGPKSSGRSETSLSPWPAPPLRLKMQSAYRLRPDSPKASRLRLESSKDRPSPRLGFTVDVAFFCITTVCGLASLANEFRAAFRWHRF